MQRKVRFKIRLSLSISHTRWIKDFRGKAKTSPEKDRSSRLLVKNDRGFILTMYEKTSNPFC